MKKYEVKTEMVVTKNGKNALAVYGGLTDQYPELVGSFDSREQALECYKNVYTGVKDCGNGRYEHDCKWIEINEYDEDGEWVAYERLRRVVADVYEVEAEVVQTPGKKPIFAKEF